MPSNSVDLIKIRLDQNTNGTKQNSNEPTPASRRSGSSAFAVSQILASTLVKTSPSRTHTSCDPRSAVLHSRTQDPKPPARFPKQSTLSTSPHSRSTVSTLTGSESHTLPRLRAPDHRRHHHATTLAPPPPPRRRRRRRRARAVQVDAGVLLLFHRLPGAALLHALRRPQARRAGRALLRRPARHPRRQLHRLRRPGPRRPHPPRGAPAPRARPLRLLRRHPQGHHRALRCAPGRHARLRRLLRLRRPHHPGLDQRLQRHPRRQARRRRRRRDDSVRAAALRLLRRRRQRPPRGVPHVRRREGGHRRRSRAEVPDHGHRPHERQRHGHPRARRR
uniref:Uncharacterized protein n=1 Tax=Oryza glumipatula TaxID=40148 RepID=A0A0E0B3R0_9ORYZ